MTVDDQNTKKEESWRIGVSFMRWQASLLVICIAVYLVLHYYIPAGCTFPRTDRLIHLDSFGRATVISAEDMDWYVGADKSVPLITQMNERNKNIESRLASLRQQLQDLATRFSEVAADPVRNAVDKGEFDTAVRRVFQLYAGLAPGTLANGNEPVVKQIQETVRELAGLKRVQQESLPLFRPPEKFKLFWVNPWGILGEVVAWSLFGLFASLLFHSAHYARKGKFKKPETVVGWSKIFYTPVVAVVLVLAIADGLLHVSSAGTRIWMIPLFGFLAGFSSRKAAKVVDGLSEWALGRMARSLQGDEDTTPSAGVVAIQKVMLPPETIDDLGNQAKTVANAMLAQKLSQLTKPS